MGGLFTGPPKLPLSAPTDSSATPSSGPSWRRPGRQSTVLAMLEPPDAEGAASLPPPSPPATLSGRGYVQLAANTTTATDGYEVAEDNNSIDPPDRSSAGMRLSPSGADFIKDQEKVPKLMGPALKPGRSVEGGNPTIGWGHKITDDELKRKVFLGGITHEQAEELLSKDIAAAERDINRRVKVPLTQEQFDALLSLRYNIGSSWFARSRALSYLNSGDFEQALKEWAEFRLSGGVARDHLERRRATEIEMFRRGMGKN